MSDIARLPGKRSESYDLVEGLSLDDEVIALPYPLSVLEWNPKLVEEVHGGKIIADRNNLKESLASLKVQRKRR